MMPLLLRHVSPFLWLGVLALGAGVALGQVNGSEEKTPPAAFQGVLNPDLSLSPPPPQPALALDLRVGWSQLETGDLSVTLRARGAPGTPFVVGAFRPETSRPVVLAVSRLDASGEWTLQRTVEAARVGAFAQVEFAISSPR